MVLVYVSVKYEISGMDRMDRMDRMNRMDRMDAIVAFYTKVLLQVVHNR